MKKINRKICVLLLVFALILTGCGNKNQILTENADVNNENTAENAEVLTIEAVSEKKESENTMTETVKMNVYCSNSDATGLECREASVSEYKPEYILTELAKVNVVSYNTKVLDFSVAQDRKHLTLDLSSEFSDYVNMMGTTGEYIVIGSLVNTFLDAYEAEDILITVQGNALETSHTIYDKPLLFYGADHADTTESDNMEKTSENPN